MWQGDGSFVTFLVLVLRAADTQGELPHSGKRGRPGPAAPTLDAQYDKGTVPLCSIKEHNWNPFVTTYGYKDKTKENH